MDGNVNMTVDDLKTLSIAVIILLLIALLVWAAGVIYWVLPFGVVIIIVWVIILYKIGKVINKWLGK